jgi:hypothetical protein
MRYRTAALSQGNVRRVWRSGIPLWSANFALGGVRFAVKTDSTVYAPIELLGRAPEPNPPDNLVLIEQLGYRLGYALEELRYGSPRARLPWISPDGKP